MIHRMGREPKGICIYQLIEAIAEWLLDERSERNSLPNARRFDAF